jgi:hypothetical protein
VRKFFGDYPGHRPGLDRVPGRPRIASREECDAGALVFRTRPLRDRF